jgi:hypothetical protein
MIEAGANSTNVGDRLSESVLLPSENTGFELLLMPDSHSGKADGGHIFCQDTSIRQTDPLLSAALVPS